MELRKRTFRNSTYGIEYTEAQALRGEGGEALRELAFDLCASIIGSGSEDGEREFRRMLMERRAVTTQPATSPSLERERLRLEILKRIR